MEMVWTRSVMMLVKGAEGGASRNEAKRKSKQEVHGCTEE